jgi:hypothetical protein
VSREPAVCGGQTYFYEPVFLCVCRRLLMSLFVSRQSSQEDNDPLLHKSHLPAAFVKQRKSMYELPPNLVCPTRKS